MPVRTSAVRAVALASTFCIPLVVPTALCAQSHLLSLEQKSMLPRGMDGARS